MRIACRTDLAGVLDLKFRGDQVGMFADYDVLIVVVVAFQLRWLIISVIFATGTSIISE